MKKILFICVLIFTSFVSCSKEDAQSVLFDKTEIKVEPQSTTFDVGVNANCTWDIQSDGANWLIFSPKDNISSEVSKVQISIKENLTYSERTAILTIVSEDGTSQSKMKIIQQENKGFVSDKTSGEYDGNEQEITVNIKTNIDNISIDTPEWITQVSKTRSLSEKNIRFKLSVNDTGFDRSGNININGDGESLIYTVKQHSITIQPTKITFKEGDDILLQDNSNYTLTPIFYPENCNIRDLNWSSSNPYVVDVSGGILKVVGNGNAIVTALNESSGVYASANVTVKIKATRIIPVSESGYNMYSDEWGFGHKDKLNLKVEPQNAYIGDVVYISSNPDIVSVENGYLIANLSKAGSSRIDIVDSYSGITSFVDIDVDRCFFYVGSTNIQQTSHETMISFGGAIYSNNTNDIFEITNVSLVDKNNHLIALADYIESPSNRVTFYTGYVNMTEKFGMTTIDYRELPEIKFLIGYKYNGGSEVYWEYVDIEILNQVVV